MKRHINELKRVGLRYHDIGHGSGSLIWWLDNKDRIKTFVSTGVECHHDIDRRINMDARWRGRIEAGAGRTTMLPPLNIYTRTPEAIRLPGKLMHMLRTLGGRQFYLDTPKGLYLIADSSGF